MCVFSTNPRLMKAERDLPVCKLVGMEDGKYVTFSTHDPIELNQLQKPKFPSVLPKLNEWNYRYEDGFVHAFTTLRWLYNYGNADGKLDERKVFKAYIPKGTLFMVNDDYSHVAAESLFVTSEEAGKGNGILKEYLDECEETIREMAIIAASQQGGSYDDPETKYPRPGDFVYSDLTFSRPTTKVPEGKTISGIVCGNDELEYTKIISLHALKDMPFDENAPKVVAPVWERNMSKSQLENLLEEEQKMSMEKMNRCLRSYSFKKSSIITETKYYNGGNKSMRWCLPLLSDLEIIYKSMYLVNAGLVLAGGDVHDINDMAASCHTDGDMVYTLNYIGYGWKEAKSDDAYARPILSLKYDEENNKFILI